MSFLDEVIKRVRDDDAARPRSVQAEVGWSEAGGCRSYLGYRLDGAWPSEEPDTWAAIRGTAIHAHLGAILGEPGVLTEVTTSYRGIPGHADLVRAGAAECWDFKTTRLANSKQWQSSAKALRQKRIQVHGYAAGLVDAGTLPEDCTAGLLVIPVDGTFADWWAYSEPFDRSLADEGADRLAWVRERMAAGSSLPKDMPYSFCESWCLAGETEVVTGSGIRPIRELAGGTHRLLVPSRQVSGITWHGRWQDCPVQSFGIQPLMAVTLRRLKSAKTIYATADHRWITESGAVARTADLKTGARLRTIRHNIPANLREVPFAVAQGFVYGDGTTPPPGAAASLMIYESSPKAKSMLGYFSGHDTHWYPEMQGWHFAMLPSSWKKAPPLDESRSFLLSWLAGYIAADGTVTAAGQTTISSARRECIELVRSICAIIGVGYSPVQVQSRVGIRQTEASDLFVVTLRTRDLPDWVFKNEHHRKRVEAVRSKKPHELSWVVESVQPTDRIEEVFCAVVPEVQAFALSDDLLTHNCEFFSLCRGSDDPGAAEEITDPTLAAAVARYGEINSIVGPLGKEKKALAPLIRGLRGTAGDWRISTGRPGEEGEEIDEAAIYADYAAMGKEVPMVTKPGTTARLTVTKIKRKEPAE